ncbi:tetratricopeptide repeat protein [Gemella bergeri ATCC 700627]|uniref:Tetratricopeptide repeat protein n=1 Tax=Gemella bergeri ATCC 700627 TaxID=1321820 RepID=U2Q008_9BACL|nr:tetratricopeptide repeat protein [Gemella bergeri]ERK56090.1 tetratricopeptide repeat protein [Gemella bergeri ATCC 700627]
MNDKKFWKIIYLHIVKYNYNILYYRPEKKDVWLINDDNELVRFIYSDNFKATEIDSVISNIIRNETRLKKMFKLKNLKIKIIFVSPEYDEVITDYKKYKISSDLIIERVLFNEKNSKLFVKERDLKFIEDSPDTSRYKTRVVELYKKQALNKTVFDVKFNMISLCYLLLFFLNYVSIYASNGNFSIYKFLGYDYQGIISGQFYRLITSIFVVNDFVSLFIVVVSIFVSSLLFNKNLNIRESLVILITTAIVFNLFLLFGYSGDLNIPVVSYPAVLGSIFLTQLSKKSNNLQFMYAVSLSLVYLLGCAILLNTNVALYIFSFIVGVFLQLFLLNKKSIYILSAAFVLIMVSGIVVKIANIDTKSKVNAYLVRKIDKRLEKPRSDEDIFNLEKELTSKNKSVLTYYELGMIKMANLSVNDAKKVFLEGIQFDSSFAPLYYKLALIERQEGNYSKSKEYADKALKISNLEKYKNLVEELSNY